MDSPLFSAFVAEVLSLYAPPLRAPQTWRALRQVLREFGELPEPPRTIADLRAPAIAAWVRAHPDRTPARTTSLLRSLAPVLRYAAEEGYAPASPFAGFRRLKGWVRQEVLAPERPQAARYRPAAEIGRLLELLDAEAAEGSWKAGRLQALVYLYAFTGLRKAEALHLRPWDLDLVKRTVTIEPRASWRPKTRKSAATLPLAAPALAVLALWLPRCGGVWLFPGVELKTPWLWGGPGQTPLDQVRAAGERAGVTGLTIASFRKTIGTMAKAWGLGPLELQALLRHSSVKTQEWYDEADVEVLRSATAKITFRVSG